MIHDDKKSRPFKHIWCDIIHELPHSEFGNFKPIAYAIVNRFMFGESLICFPGIGEIMKKTGMSRSTVIRGINAFVEAGWLGRREGGGTTADGKGISTQYWLSIPCQRWNCIDLATVSEYHAYSVRLADQQCQNDGATVSLLTLEQSLNQFLKQHKNQLATGNDEDRTGYSSNLPTLVSTNEMVPSLARHLSVSTDETRARDLPTATAAQRASWGELWPSPDATIRPIDPAAPLSVCRNRMIYDFLEVMGYRTDDDGAHIRMPQESGYRYRDAWLRDQIPSSLLDLMAEKHLSGALKATDVASALASLTIQPCASRQEARNEAAA